jgi:hypothetical protein
MAFSVASLRVLGVASGAQGGFSAQKKPPALVD